MLSRHLRGRDAGVTELLPELSPGHYVPHFEAKADVTTYLEKSGLPHTVPTLTPFPAPPYTAR